MIPRTTLLCILFLVLLTFTIFAQKGETYFRFNFGYDFSLAGAGYGTSTVDQTNQYSQQLLSGSFGNGINMAILGGYYLVNEVSLELGYQFMPSSKVLYRESLMDNYTLKTDARTFSHCLKIGPGFYYPWEQMDVTFFGRFGILIPVSRYAVMDSYVAGHDAQMTYSFTTDQTEEFTFNFAPGFYASIGGMTDVTKRIAVYGELEFQAGSARYTSSELTRYKWVKVQNDVEQVRELYNLTASERYSNYYKEIDSDDNIPANPDFDVNKATDKLTQYLPFNSVGINLGIIYTFKWQDIIRTGKK